MHVLFTGPRPGAQALGWWQSMRRLAQTLVLALVTFALAAGSALAASPDGDARGGGDGGGGGPVPTPALTDSRTDSRYPTGDASARRQPIVLTGTLATTDGIECPKGRQLIADDGRRYTLHGDLAGYRDGQRVRVLGQPVADVCMIGPAIRVLAIVDGGASPRPPWSRSLAGAQARTAFGLIGVEVRWWGVIVSLDREWGCFAATGIPALEELIKSVVPSPFGDAVVAAIRWHKGWIGRNVGTDGLDLHFNWAGFLHWVEPRGPREGC